MKRPPFLCGKISLTKIIFTINLLLLFLIFDASTHTPSYRKICKKILRSHSKLSTFRQIPEVREKFDFVKQKDSLSYIEWLKDFGRELNNNEENRLIKQDTFGKPIVHSFKKYVACPTTWRTVKIAQEIKNEFGDLADQHLIDIGGGYGGLCRILALLEGFGSYTFVNYSECNQVIQRFLEPLNLSNVFYIDLESYSENTFSHYDLIISDQSFFELEDFQQNRILEHLIRKIANGYFIFSSSKNAKIDSKQSSLIKILMDEGYYGKLRPIIPAIGKEGRLLTWKDAKRKHSLHAEYPPVCLGKIENLQNNKAISYELTGGRFGDNLVAYLHAKWLSYQYQLPLLCVPFQYSDKLCLSDYEKFNDSLDLSRQPFIAKDTFHTFNSSSKATLWILKPFPECFYEFIDPQLQANAFKNLKFFCVDWQDETFLSEIKKCLKPINPLYKFELSHEFINVALHVRKICSSPFDGLPVRDYFPLKFPNDDYYLNQLKWLTKFYPDKNLFVFIFTDDPNPAAIAQSYQEKLQNPRIFFWIPSIW